MSSAEIRQRVSYYLSFPDGLVTQRVRFLLGSPPETTHSALAESPSAYRDVLRASAAFIRAVYDARWVRGHKHDQRNEGNADGVADGEHAAGS